MLTALLVLLGAVLAIFAGEAVRGQCRRMLDGAVSASVAASVVESTTDPTT